MANKVGIKVQDELGNVKGENDFVGFVRACEGLRAHELAAYVEENGGKVADERKSVLIRQAWDIHQMGTPAPGNKTHENEPQIFGGGLQQALTVTEEEIAEALETDAGADTVVAADATEQDSDSVTADTA